MKRHGICSLTHCCWYGGCWWRSNGWIMWSLISGWCRRWRCNGGNSPPRWRRSGTCGSKSCPPPVINTAKNNRRTTIWQRQKVYCKDWEGRGFSGKLEFHDYFFLLPSREEWLVRTQYIHGVLSFTSFPQLYIPIMSGKGCGGGGVKRGRGSGGTRGKMREECWVSLSLSTAFLKRSMYSCWAEESRKYIKQTHETVEPHNYILKSAAFPSCCQCCSLISTTTTPKDLQILNTVLQCLH